MNEKELLSIVETLKEFRTILLGKRLKIYTDHKNLTCKNFNTDRVLIWIIILGDYGPDIEHIQSALSIFPINGNQESTQESIYEK